MCHGRGREGEELAMVDLAGREERARRGGSGLPNHEERACRGGSGLHDCDAMCIQPLTRLLGDGRILPPGSV